MTATYSCHVQL